MSKPDDQVKLQELCRSLAATASGPVSGAIEDRLRMACRARRAEQRKWRYGSMAAGVAACLLVALGWEWHVAHKPTSPGPAPETNYAGFVALPYAQSDVPMEQAVVVRVNLQPADLAGLGLPPALLVGRSRMHADLLMGQDGVARAVRLSQ